MLLKFISHFYNGSDKDYKSLLWWKEVQSLFKLRIITIKVSLAKLNQCLPRICFPSQEKAIKWNMVEDTFVNLMNVENASNLNNCDWRYNPLLI